MDAVKDKIMSLFNTNETKKYCIPTHVKIKYGVEKKPRKPTRKTQSEEKIVSDTKSFFEQEEDDYYQPVTEGNFYSNILWQYFILNMKIVLEMDPITQEYLNEITPYL